MIKKRRLKALIGKTISDAYLFERIGEEQNFVLAIKFDDLYSLHFAVYGAKAVKPLVGKEMSLSDVLDMGARLHRMSKSERSANYIAKRPNKKYQPVTKRDIT